MRIDTVECFYFSIPEIKLVGDGSQDALLFRVAAGNLVGWGECEASPLVSISNWVCPPSHSACMNPQTALLGAKLTTPEDIESITGKIKEYGLDIAQTSHTLSGIEIALWDLLGKARGEPVYHLLGYSKSHRRQPYASLLFGETPEETLEKAKAIRRQNYRAVKFGWGPFGKATPEADAEQIAAAREGLQKDGILLIDAGTVWNENVERAAAIVPALESHEVTWLEEPFVGEATNAYYDLSQLMDETSLAGGEGASSFHDARQLMDHGGIRFIQIDTGRIGGIRLAKKVADYAQMKGISYVNHTFTTHLALSASLQPYAGHSGDLICEYPAEPSSLASSFTKNRLERDADGLVQLPEKPGLGVEPDLDALRPYLQDVRIEVNGKVLYTTPDLK